MLMRSNLWYQINKFVYKRHIFGVYKHKNFQRGVNVYKNKCMVPNKQFYVYLQIELRANKHLFK